MAKTGDFCASYYQYDICFIKPSTQRIVMMANAGSTTTTYTAIGLTQCGPSQPVGKGIIADFRGANGFDDKQFSSHLRRAFAGSISPRRAFQRLRLATERKFWHRFRHYEVLCLRCCGLIRLNLRQAAARARLRASPTPTCTAATIHPAYQLASMLVCEMIFGIL